MSSLSPSVSVSEVLLFRGHSFIHSASICSLPPRPGGALGCRGESECGSLQGSHGPLLSSLLPQLGGDLTPIALVLALSPSPDVQDAANPCPWEVCHSYSSSLRKWLPSSPHTRQDPVLVSCSCCNKLLKTTETCSHRPGGQSEDVGRAVLPLEARGQNPRGKSGM